MNHLENNESQLETIPKSIIKENNSYCFGGLILGILSFFFSLLTYGIIPIAGTVVSILGLYKFDKTKEKNVWMGVVGTIVSIIYIIATVYAYA